MTKKLIPLCIVTTLCLPVLSCSRPPGIGLGGRYLDGKSELLKHRGADIGKAVALLEEVAARDPLYKDSLTLLARAYYRNGCYRDARQIVRRALAADPNDEIAWIMLGLTDLQLGVSERGLNSLKGGITLLSKASKPGFRGIQSWDRNGAVRRAISRAAFATLKGGADKNQIIRSSEQLIQAVDQEEWMGTIEQEEEQRMGL